MTAAPGGGPALHQGIRTFLMVWLGSTVSALGSALAGFVIGVWAFQQTGSATLYSLIAVAGIVPALIVTPFAGALADRWDRRLMMVWSTVAAMSITAVTTTLMITGRLEVWHLYVTAFVSSIVGATVRPASMGATTSLIPPDQFARAAGLMQFGGASIRIIAPVLAGILLARIGVPGVLLLNVASFLAALAVLLVVRIPQPHRAGPDRPRGSILASIGTGWRYVRERPGIFGLLLYFSAIGAAPTISMVLLTPLILRIANEVVLGTVMSAGALGTLTGGLVMSTWGGPKRRFRGIMLAGVILGLSMIVAGARSEPLVIAAGVFGVMMGGPIMTTSFNAFWQTRTPLELHGRVFSIITMVAESSMPLALLSAGPLTDFLLEPLMRPGGALADVLGPYLGTGPGRGIGLLFILLGVFVLIATTVASRLPRLRYAEDELPVVVAPRKPGQPMQGPAPAPKSPEAAPA